MPSFRYNSWVLLFTLLLLSSQVHEFSVEPPGHSDDEYEVMEQSRPSYQPDEQESHARSVSEAESHRLHSVDTHSRHIKSLSLPYVTSPLHGPEESGSDDQNNAEDYSSSEDEDSMFVKSLPADFFLKELSGSEPEIERQDQCAPGVHPEGVEVTEDAGLEHSAGLESTGDQKQADIEDNEGNEGWEESKLSRREEKDNNHQEPTHLGNKGQR